jgi:hypothetical protein
VNHLANRIIQYAKKKKLTELSKQAVSEKTTERKKEEKKETFKFLVQCPCLSSLSTYIHLICKLFF